MYHNVDNSDGDSSWPWEDDYEWQDFQDHLWDRDLVTQIIRMKHNDTEVDCLEIYDGVTRVNTDEDDGWDDHNVWIRLGNILGYNEYVELVRLSGCTLPTWTWLGRALGQNASITELNIGWCNVDMVAVSDGLQRNQSIRKLILGNFNLPGHGMSCLATSLRQIPSLTELSLEGCSLGSPEIDILSEALLGRSQDTLEALHLRGNGFGDINLDGLISALNGSRNMSKVNLDQNEIGPRGCASISMLLQNSESNLKELHLNDNLIIDESVTTFANLLAKNAKLAELALGENDGITTVGWLALLKLVCDGSSINGVINSNHTLWWLGDITHAIGADDNHLLRASLELNGNVSDKSLVARHKILWSHARGDINIGEEPSIAVGVMPRILAWMGDDSIESNASLIQYQIPLLPKATIDIIRLGSFYRSIRSRPSILQDGCSRKRGCDKRTLDGMKELRDENKRLRAENKRLRDSLQKLLHTEDSSA